MFTRRILRLTLRNATNRSDRSLSTPLQPIHAKVGVVPIVVGLIGAGGLAYFGQKSLGDSKPVLPPLAAVVPPLDLQQATQKLAKEQYHERFEEGEGGDFFTVRLASNSPIEDELSHGSAIGVGKQTWRYWGVYDGHAGWATSAVLHQSLIPYVSQYLSALKLSSSSSEIINTIKKAFMSLDDDIFDTARAAIALNSKATSMEAISALAPAIAGSCAIFSAYNPQSSTLYTACTGDSRAVLGRLTPSSSSTHTCLPLSIDQNGHNPTEHARLTALHPNEPNMINPKTGRLLGWALSRAFGDSRGKWTNAEQQTSFDRFWAQRALYDRNFTPPYFTAEPEVTVTEVRTGDFAILASDGLWDHISSEDAVECVSQWAAAVRKGVIEPFAGRGREMPTGPLEAPAFEREDEDSKFITWRATPEHFVVEDANAATHLVKNAFGGSRRGLFCSVISTYPPISRYVRDDITVQVVFFGDALKRE